MDSAGATGHVIDGGRMTFVGNLLAGRVALVTGGATGIGRVLARGLAEHGAAVAIASRRLELCEQAAAEIRAAGGTAEALQCDVRDPEACEAAVASTVERLGRIDVLINNAGANFLSPATAIRPKGWRAVTGTLIDGTFFMSQAAGARMIESGGGAIVNVSATNAWTGSPLMSHSGAGKAAINSLTQTLAVEWAPFGVRVNAIAPGPVMTEGSRERLWRDPEQVRRLEQTIPMGRFATPEDCLGPVLFLLSDAAAFVTGAVLTVDGGDSLRSLPELAGA